MLSWLFPSVSLNNVWELEKEVFKMNKLLEFFLTLSFAFFICGLLVLIFLMNFEDVYIFFEDSVINMAIWSATKIDRFIGEIFDYRQNLNDNWIQSRSVKELVRILKKYDFGFLKGRWNLNAKQDRKIRTHVRKSNCLIK